MALFKRSNEGGVVSVIRSPEEDYLVHKWRPGGKVGESKRENAIRWGSSLRVRDGEGPRAKEPSRPHSNRRSAVTERATSAGQTLRGTDPNAAPVEFRTVTDALVVEIRGGRYRLANVDGILEVAPRVARPVEGAAGAVGCLAHWGDFTPQRQGHIRVRVAEGQWRLRSGYSGEVINRFGRS
jgi:hypothetical protein